MKSLKTVRTLSSAITAKVSIIATPNSIKTMELNQHTNTRGSMWNFAKKLALAGVSTLLVATASLSAAYNDYYDYEYNPGYNTGSNDFCCGDWSLEAEFLYWRANVDELPVGRSLESSTPATTTVIVPGGPTLLVQNGQQLRYFTKYLDSDWRPGARVTLGYHCPGSCWDWKLAWTWIYSRAKASLSDIALSDTNVIEPAWTSGATQPFSPVAFGPITGQHIHGNWSLNFNAIEFGAGYTFTACCDQFRVRPHFDVKYASIRQRATFSSTTDYTGVVVTGPLTLPFSFVDQVQLHRDYNGVGPQIGVDLHYTLCGGLGLYAKAAAAILYAEPEIKFRGKVKSVSETAVLNFDSNHTFRNRTDPRHLNLNTTLGAGVEYSRYVCGGKYRAFAKLGWEHQLFTNQNQFHRAVLAPGAAINDILFPVEHGDLSLYGLTASIGFDY